MVSLIRARSPATAPYQFLRRAGVERCVSAFAAIAATRSIAARGVHRAWVGKIVEGGGD